MAPVPETGASLPPLIQMSGSCGPAIPRLCVMVTFSLMSPDLMVAPVTPTTAGLGRILGVPLPFLGSDLL